MIRNTEQRDSARRILLVSLDNVGDLVFATSLMRPLRERFPEAHIGLWCKDYSSDLARLMPEVDEVFAADTFWDRSPGRDRGSLSQFVVVLRRIRRERFDTAILCHAPSRTAAAVAATAIPVRIGLQRGRNGRWLTHVRPPADRTKPVLLEMSRLLTGFGIVAGEPRCRLDPTGFAAEKETIHEALGGIPRVALHPFAGADDRCVGFDVWMVVADALADAGFAPLWVGTLAELDRLRGRVESGDSANERRKWLYTDAIVGDSLLGVALAISETDLFIGHDSGPLHIASALGIPTVGIFAPGEPSRTFPQGSGEWRIIARESPAQVAADEILSKAMSLVAPVNK